MRFLAVLGLFSLALAAQPSLPLAHIEDDGSLPLHTLYTAPRERSLYVLDQGYRLQLRDASRPLGLLTDSAGSLYFYFKRNTLLVGPLGEYVQPPRMQESYADGALFGYSPLAGLEVEHRLAVFSSTLLIQELSIRNTSAQDQQVDVLMLLERDEPLRKPQLKGHNDTLFFTHKESWKDWASVELEAFEDELEDMILLDRKVDSWGGYKEGVSQFLAEARGPHLSSESPKKAKALALSVNLEVAAGESQSLRVIRAAGLRHGIIWTQANRILFTFPFQEVFEQSRQTYQGAAEEARDLLDWQALSLARQMMYPPEGAAAFPYLVDSREPTWAGGHDGQSLYNALALLVLARTDLPAARDAMRLFMAQQRPDGSFPPRVGPFLQEFLGKKSFRRESPPLFAWLCLQLHRRGEDLGFLQEAFAAGVRHAQYWQRRLGDGLADWSQPPEGLPYPLDLKATRDDPGLNALLVGQMKSLAEMASALGRAEDAEAWRSRAHELAQRINSRLWDEERDIYRPLPAQDDPKAPPVDSIGGLLPLWSGVPGTEQARRLLAHAQDGGRLRVAAGLALQAGASGPNVSAANGSPEAGPGDGDSLSCCGPRAVSLPLNYLLWLGLRQYGFEDEARRLEQDLRSAVRQGVLQRGFFSDTFAPGGDRSEPRPHVLGSLIVLFRE